MTGYQEIITDPSYDGQMITFTYPHIGNTGINSVDYESKKIFARGLIVRDFCTFPSNWRSEQSLDDYLKLNKTICISNIDTRFLTKKIRDEGCKVGVIYPSEKITDKEASLSVIFSDGYITPTLQPSSLIFFVKNLVSIFEIHIVLFNLR